MSNKTTLTKRELAAVRQRETREQLEHQRERFMETSPCGVCWTDDEHAAGYCQTDDGQRQLEQNQNSADGRPDNAATEKQLNFIRTLVEERDVIKSGYTFEDWAKGVSTQPVQQGRSQPADRLPAESGPRSSSSKWSGSPRQQPAA